MADHFVVVAAFMTGTASIAAGTKAYVLHVGAAGCVEIVTRTRSGSHVQKSEPVTNLGTFKVEPVTVEQVPASVWRWARATTESCEDLLDLCNELRIRMSRT